MDLALTESQKMFKSGAREFLKEECAWAQVKEIDESSSGFSPALWKKVAEMGWLGMALPESCGGMGCSLLDLAVVYEEMGYSLLPLAFFNSSVLCGNIIEAVGDEASRASLLPGLGSGKDIYTLALTEADYGWGAGNISLRAIQEGDHYVLNGLKRFVPDAEAANKIIVAARTGRDDDSAHGISLFVVDRESRGLSTRHVQGFTGERLYEVHLQDVVVPSTSLLGVKDQAWNATSRALDRATAVLCAYMVGGCQYLLDLTVQYAQTRVQFNQPIGAFQWVQGYIVEQANQLQRARWTAYEALWKLDSNKPADDQAAAVALAKTVASEAFLECGHLSHEVHAGIGVDKKYPLYLWSKKSKTLFSFLGDPNWQRARLAKYLRL